MGAQMAVEPGLCAGCGWAQAIESAKGSRFLRCGRSDADSRFPRYPPLPVRTCEGFERRGEASQSQEPNS